MSSSLKLGRIAGIPVFVHWTFFILIAFIVFGHVQAGHDLMATLEGVGFILALFGCVVLHELGHALAARRYGVPTTDITLLPIGGVARLQRIPEQPSQELVVAIAGPLVNVVIVGLLLLIGVRLPQASAVDPETLINTGFFSNLLMVNIFLVLFNLLPAFPMDGGRMLRALLAMKLDYARATRIAATVGQFMAILFVIRGLSGAPMLILIALFVWIGAEAEARMVQERVVLKDVPVREAMLTEYRTLSPGDTLGHAADLLLAGTQQDFPIVEHGRALGVLTRPALMQGLAQAGRDASVADFRGDGVEVVEADSMLVPAIAKLREGGHACLLVVDGGREVGLLTPENIGEFLMIQTALDHANGAGAADGPRPNGFIGADADRVRVGRH